MADPNDNPLRRPEHADDLRGNLAGDGPHVRVTDTGIREVGFDDPELIIPADKLHYHVPHPDPHPEQHEHSDVPIRPLAITLGAIAALLLFSFVFLFFLFKRYEGQQESMEIPRTGVTNVQGQSVVRPVVPEPRLEGVPGFSNDPYTQQLSHVRQQHNADLNAWGPSGEDGFAKIPIDRAMDLALERGTFKTAPPPQGASGGGQPQQQTQPQQPPQQQPPAGGQPPRSPRREGAR